MPKRTTSSTPELADLALRALAVFFFPPDFACCTNDDGDKYEIHSSYTLGAKYQGLPVLVIARGRVDPEGRGKGQGRGSWSTDRPLSSTLARVDQGSYL